MMSKVTHTLKEMAGLRFEPRPLVQMGWTFYYTANPPMVGEYSYVLRGIINSWKQLNATVRGTTDQNSSVDCHCGHWPSTPPERSSGRRQGWCSLCCEKNWQNRPWDNYFQKILWAQVLASSISRKAQRLLTVTSALAIEEGNVNTFESQNRVTGSDIQGKIRWPLWISDTFLNWWKLKFSELCQTSLEWH